MQLIGLLRLSRVSLAFCGDQLERDSDQQGLGRQVHDPLGASRAVEPFSQGAADRFQQDEGESRGLENDGDAEGHRRGVNQQTGPEAEHDDQAGKPAVEGRLGQDKDVVRAGCDGQKNRGEGKSGAGLQCQHDSRQRNVGGRQMQVTKNPDNDPALLERTPPAKPLVPGLPKGNLSLYFSLVRLHMP